MNIIIRGGTPLSQYGNLKPFSREIESNPILLEHRVITIAKKGDSTFELIWNYDHEIAPLHPDILILQFGVDDMFRPVYRSEFKENLVQAIRKTRKLFSSKIILCTTHLFRDPYENKAADIYNRATREVALDLGCDYIPLHLVWMNFMYENNVLIDDLLETDARYPGQHGRNIIANAFIDRLRQIL